MFCFCFFFLDKFVVIFWNFVMSSRLCNLVQFEVTFKIHSNGFWCHEIRWGGSIWVTFGVDVVTIGGLIWLIWLTFGGPFGTLRVKCGEIEWLWRTLWLTLGGSLVTLGVKCGQLEWPWGHSGWLWGHSGWLWGHFVWPWGHFVWPCGAIWMTLRVKWGQLQWPCGALCVTLIAKCGQLVWPWGAICVTLGALCWPWRNFRDFGGHSG